MTGQLTIEDTLREVLRRLERIEDVLHIEPDGDGDDYPYPQRNGWAIGNLTKGADKLRERLSAIDKRVTLLESHTHLAHTAKDPSEGYR